MKKFFRSKLNLIVTLILTVGILTSGGIWAFSAAKVARSNVVTINPSEIKIVASLDESAVDEQGNVIAGADRVYSNNYILLPGTKNVTKDPVFHIKEGSGWIFILIDDQISLYENNDSTRPTPEQQMVTNGWVKVSDYGVFGRSHGTLYVYNRVVSATENIPVFSSFSLKTHSYIINGMSDYINLSGFAMSDSSTSPEFSDANSAYTAFYNYMRTARIW